METGTSQLVERFTPESRAALSDDAEFHLWLGRARSALDENEAAEESYREAIRLYPEYAGAYNDLGDVLAVDRVSLDVRAGALTLKALEGDLAVLALDATRADVDERLHALVLAHERGACARRGIVLLRPCRRAQEDDGDDREQHDRGLQREDHADRPHHDVEQEQRAQRRAAEAALRHHDPPTMKPRLSTPHRMPQACTETSSRP